MLRTTEDNLDSFIQATTDYAVHYNRHFHKFYREKYQGDALLSKAKSHAIYHYIISSKDLLKSNKIKLKHLHEQLIELNIGIHTDYGYFTRLLKRMQKPGYSIESELAHDSKGKLRSSKFCIELIEKAEVLYAENPMWKYPRLLNEVNLYAKTLGLQEISINHIKRYFGQNHVQKRLRCVRNGEDYFQANVGHQNHLKTPYNAGRQLEIDGTRLQIPFYNTEKKDIDFLVIFCILDITSNKVLGYSLGKSESSSLVVEAFRRFFEIYNFLPIQITRDNSSAYFSDFKFIELYTTLKGVEWVATSNPRGCSHISNFQKAFAQSICSSIDSYIGLGIRTKDIDSRLNAKQLKKRIRDKKKTLLIKDELIFELDRLIVEYNSHEFQGNNSANKKFDKRFEWGEVIPLNEADQSLLKGTRKVKSVKNSEIKITLNKKSYFYKLEYAMAEKLEKVIVSYDKKDLSNVYLFDMKYEFLVKVKLDEFIPSLKEERSDKEQINLIRTIKARKKKYTAYVQNIKDKKQRSIDRLDKVIPLYDYNADSSKEQQISIQNAYSRRYIDSIKDSEEREGENSLNENDPYFDADITKITNQL